MPTVTRKRAFFDTFRVSALKKDHFSKSDKHPDFWDGCCWECTKAIRCPPGRPVRPVAGTSVEEDQTGRCWDELTATIGYAIYVLASEAM